MKLGSLFVLLLCSAFVSTAIVDAKASTAHRKHRKLRVVYSPSFPKKQKAKYRVVITSNPAAFGERQASIRIANAASKLGWEWALVDRLDRQPNLLNCLQPNFVISLREEITPVKSTVPHFLYLHVPMFMLLNKNRSLAVNAYPNILKYDAFLNVVPDVSIIANAYKKKKQKKFRSINTVFSVSKTKFVKTPKQNLCYWGTTWDSLRGSEKYINVYKKLDKTPFFRVYGPGKSWKKLNLKAYQGELPFDNDSLLLQLQRHGIALLLHSGEHLRGAVPTSRIFEAAAASTLIICDEHPFVKQVFGDSVLYLDTTKSPQKIFQQIRSYVKWAHREPKKALNKASESHAIFLKNYTLENELMKVEKLYESLKNNN